MKDRIVAGMVLGTCLILFSGIPAYAYLDPGTGSAILQGILAALAAIAVALKLYWHRFLRLLGLKKKKLASTKTENEKSNTNTSDNAE